VIDVSSETQIDYGKGIKYMKWVCDQAPENGHPIHAKYPKNLMVEVTNACNLKCIMCDNRKMKRKRGFMSLETYNLVLKNAKEIGIEMVGLYTTGESLLHPQIFDFIKMAKDMGFKYVYLTTNGIPLNAEKIKKIIESGLDSIKFSIDAATKETYEKLRVGGDFDLLHKNIKMLREIRDREKSKLKIYSSFVLTNENYQELKLFKEFWKGLVDEVIIYPVSNQASHQIDEFNKLVPEKIKRIIKKKKVKYCNRLWNRIIVLYDGKFTICPEDFEGELVYGDIHKESMKEAWNNEKMKKFRMMFKTGNFDQSQRCKTCNTYLTDSVIIEEL
jgi:radical SAM protein with 4Fe4S-binding SPASM domain